MYIKDGTIAAVITLKYHADWPSAIDTILTAPDGDTAYNNDVLGYVQPLNGNDGSLTLSIVTADAGMFRLQISDGIATQYKVLGEYLINVIEPTTTFTATLSID